MAHEGMRRYLVSVRLKKTGAVETHEQYGFNLVDAVEWVLRYYDVALRSDAVDGAEAFRVVELTNADG